MNEKERIRIAIKEWEEQELPGVFERPVELKLFTQIAHIIDIVGARRSGKTYIMYMIIKRLLAEGVDKGSLIYINFENRVLYPLNEKLLEELMNYIFEKKLEKVFLFLDEIQNIKGWERWARNVYDDYKGKIKIVVSGSTSKIIKGKTATLLTGRHIPIKVYPLRFKEFLEFRNIEFNKEIFYSRRKQAEIKALFQEYLRFGGFPEIALIETMLKKDLLNAYYDDFLHKDVIDKFNIRETNILENFVKFLFLNISSYFSYKRGKEYLDAYGIKTSTRTLLRYTSILEDAFLFFFVPIFTKKVRHQLKYPKKVYCVDVGLRNVVSPFSGDYGRILENLVYLELRRQNKGVFYWREKDLEVDFIVKNGKTELIQVAWQVENKETKERETKALLKAMQEFKLKNGLVITEDYETEEKIEGKKIIFIPFWKWALNR